MKTEMKPNSMKKGLELPPELLEKTTLKDAKRITVYGNECGVVMMNEAMTAMQIIRAVDMLNTVTLGLIMRLENAARLHEERCRKIAVPEELLDLAGIPRKAPLRICAEEGEIYITVADEDDDDPVDALPSFLRDLLDDRELDFGALRCLLESEELIHE
jgi:hypothetical protein